MHGQVYRARRNEQHYLERELADLVYDQRIWQFIRSGSLDGIWYWDLQNPDQDWLSPEFWDMLGINPATYAHAPLAWHDLIHEDDLEKAKRNFRAHFADANRPFDQILRFVHADGSPVWVRCRGIAIRAPDGTPIRMLGGHYNVTSQKRAEATASAKQAHALQTDEELRAFAYSTSHDLKSPANTIRMLLQEARLALHNGDPREADAMLQKAETTNEAMRTMVDKLLEYTRMVGDHCKHAPVDLDRLLGDVCDSLAADIRQTGAEVHIDTLGVVLGVDWQLRQMFQNFISNALKFQNEGDTPKVEIRSVAAPLGRIGIEIADNGIGIAPEKCDRIFELFAKLHRPSVYAGSGVGLAFCARVARSHNAKINVRPRPDGGTVFSIHLPKSEEEDP